MITPQEQKELAVGWLACWLVVLVLVAAIAVAAVAVWRLCSP